MAARYRYSTQVGATTASIIYRFDTVPSTDSPAALSGPYSDVALRAGGYFRADLVGQLPQFSAAEAVLWRKPMVATAAQHAAAVAVVGVDRAPDPSEPIGGVSLAELDAAVDAAVAASVDAAVAGKADASTTITAGTGLTGGGDLSANRTLAVAYGTTSTTATAGNDTRVVNAVQSTTTTTIVQLTQAAYNALTPVSTTLYVVVG